MDHSVKSTGASNTVRSVGRAIDLLEILMSASEPMSLTEISEQAELHPSTAHRLLATLEKKRFAHQDEDSKLYSLGPKLNLLLAEGSRPYAYLRDQVTPILQQIAEELGENVSFSIQNGYQAMLLAQVYSGRLVQVRIQDAIQAPLHCTAVGKVMLAHLGPDEVRHILRETGLPSLTPQTITGITELEAELDRVRERGYATDMEEWVEGIRCVARPVFAIGNRVIGAISVSVPASRLTQEQQLHFAGVIGKFTAKLADRIVRDVESGDGLGSRG